MHRFYFDVAPASCMLIGNKASRNFMSGCDTPSATILRR